MRFPLVSSAFFALFVFALTFNSNAQCKLFTKKSCMGELAPYSHNGQYSGAIMFEGEEATLVQTFYSNQNYRLSVCTQDIIKEGMFFELLDYKNQKIFSSKGTTKTSFDFNVESTQQLKIRLVVPAQNPSSEIKKNGCVSILIGFKEK